MAEDFRHIRLLYRVYSGRRLPAFERSQLCLSFAARLQPLLPIGYFRQLSAVQSKSSDSPKPSQRTTLLLTARLFGMVMFLGVRLMGEGIRAIRPQPEAVIQARFFKARTFKDRHGDTLSYPLLTPEGYAPKLRYLLVVSLHGGAYYGTYNVRQLAGWKIQQLTEPENRKKYPAFILAPQIAHGTNWGGLPHLVTRDTIVFHLLRALRAEFSIEPNRIYVIGHSLGYGTWHFIGTRPDLLAAAVPLRSRLG